MIKALILDIDGVIVGNKSGLNFPDPHPKVIDALGTIHATGMPITLCTAKPAFSIESIIRAAHLDNPHITNGGAIITDPVDNCIIAQHAIDRTLAQQIAAFALEHGMYLEFYTADDCYILHGQQSDITTKHAEVEHRFPTLVDDFAAFLGANDIVKIFILTHDEHEKEVFHPAFVKRFGDSVNFSWTVHPILLPGQFGVVTARGVSKAHGAQETARSCGIALADTLGVGDTMHDWQFMELCGYVAAMGNATDDLKERVTQRAERGYIGPSVDEHGIIDILRHFSVL